MRFVVVWSRKIGQRFFAIPIDDHGDKEQDAHSTDGVDNKIGSRTEEEYQLNYRNDDDNNKDSQTDKKVGERQFPTKTLVFKGHGMKEEQPTSPIARSDGNREMKYSLPPRDTISERQMVQELQNRITAMRQAEDGEDEDQDDLGTATSVKNLAQSSRLPAAPLFLGAAGSLLSELRQTLPSPSSNYEEHVLEE